LKMTDVLADYRRYVMPVPFYTLAGRILHFGRYGHDGEDPRLVPIYLGAPTLVRGYDVNSFSGSECTVTPTGSCEEFDRLLGSRVLVGNLEWRFPLLRPFGVRSGMYGPIPTEIAIFADAGVAWNAGERPAIFGGQRQAVSSVGVAVRARLFDLLILEFDVSKPFQRRGRGPVFQLTVSPGF
jgi:outer membrane protein assembly factor BamA